MKLADDAGNRLELHIAGYQFPDHDWRDDRYDANWVMVEGEATKRGRAWRFRDPCLLTFEIERLAMWLEAVAHGEHPVTIFFVEPNLGFDMPSSGVGVRAHLSHEARPEWASKWKGDFYIDLRVSVERLAEAADSLRVELARFPIRGPAPGTQGWRDWRPRSPT